MDYRAANILHTLYHNAGYVVGGEAGDCMHRVSSSVKLPPEVNVTDWPFHQRASPLLVSPCVGCLPLRQGP